MFNQCEKWEFFFNEYICWIYLVYAKQTLELYFKECSVMENHTTPEEEEHSVSVFL